MARHVIQQVVKYGHWKHFTTAHDALNRAGGAVGLPAYRLFASQWGAMNEAFTEAEYEDAASIERITGAAMQDPATLSAFREMTSHLVEGSARDYVLVEEK